MSEISTLIAETLVLPADFKGCFATIELNKLFPDKAILQVSSSYFDLEKYANDGHCTIAMRPDVVPDTYLNYRGIKYSLSTEARNVWYEINWQGKKLQAVFISWQKGFHEEHKQGWIIADSVDIAREFYKNVCDWNAEVRGEVLVFDGGCWHKDETLFQAIKNATFDNLILPPALQKEIQDDFAQFFASREIYERYRIPWKRGVLLLGQPGNGKTHTIKALLNWLDVPCLYVKSFKSQYTTDMANIASVFQRARQTTPCLLVLEDLDSLINDQNRSFFLNELDGFATNTGIVLLATTNHPERLDPALINRPSRFDRKYYFDLPKEPERFAYIRFWNDAMEHNLKIGEESIADVVAATEGFSFAYLKELFLSAMMRWISNPSQAGMAAVLIEQCLILREQMNAMQESAPIMFDSYEDQEEYFPTDAE